MPPIVKNLTLGDLELGLRDLFEQRKAALALPIAAKIYVPELADKRAAIEGLPEAIKGGRANAEELATCDTRHDGFGAALWSYTEALFLAPDTSDDEIAAAQRIRDAFIPERGALRDSYAEEAATAKKNRPKLAELEQDLRSFPLRGNKSLYDWVQGFLDEGDTLDKLLSDRSMTELSAPARKQAGELRGSTIGALNRFRKALRDEIKNNPALPRDLEGQLFSYFDELSARRKRKKKTGEGSNEGASEGEAPQG